MLAFLKAYGVTILLAVLIVALLFFAIRYTLRHRHDGCGGCSHCPMPVTVTGSIPTISDCARTVCLPDFTIGEAFYFVEYCASFLQDTAIIWAGRVLY